jgi:hypothetical protein
MTCYYDSPPGCELFRVPYPVCAKSAREVWSQCTPPLGKDLFHFPDWPGLAAPEHGAKHFVINGLQRRGRILGSPVLLMCVPAMRTPELHFHPFASGTCCERSESRRRTAGATESPARYRAITAASDLLSRIDRIHGKSEQVRAISATIL